VILDCAYYLTTVSIDKMDAMMDEWTNTSPGKTKVSNNPSSCYITQSYYCTEWLAFEFEKQRVMTCGGMMFTLSLMIMCECFRCFSGIRIKHIIQLKAIFRFKLKNYAKINVNIFTIRVMFMLNLITVTLTYLATWELSSAPLNSEDNYTFSTSTYNRPP
jgi:hypothetical protein